MHSKFLLKAYELLYRFCTVYWCHLLPGVKWCELATLRKTAILLVHGQVTIIFVVSVCLFVCLSVCLCRVFLSRL